MPPNEFFAAAASTPARKIDSASGLAHDTRRAVAAEIPVSFVYGDAPYAVMMASPGDWQDFAYGFTLTEGLIRSAVEIRGLKVSAAERGIKLEIELSPGRFREHLARRRALIGRTSCGLCGVETVEQLPQAVPLAPAAPISTAAVFAALANLDRNQPLNEQTRAVHAAAFCARDGAILAVREDVGRHNALDKLIGALLRKGVAAHEGFILVTSRASFEMVEKAAIFGATTLVAISAPTGLAIERAQALGMTLAAVARTDGAMVFAGALDPAPREPQQESAAS